MSNHKDTIFGIRAVIEAIDAKREINRILIQKGLNNPLIRELTAKLKDIRHLVQYVPIQKLDSITRKNHQGVVAFISPVTYHDLDQIIPSVYEAGEVPLILMLDRITDVRNFGAIARTAECMGVHAIVVPQKGGALITGDAVKTSAGALNRIPVCRVRFLDQIMKELKNFGLQTVGCTEKTDVLLESVDLSAPTVLIMGSEEDGLSDAMMDSADQLVRIPMVGHTQSLNVSVATGIALYEVVKQRGHEAN